MPPKQQTDWHQLAEQASQEMDSEKLLSLVNELNQALDEGGHNSQRPPAKESI